MDRDRILCTDVDITLVCADRIAGDRHCLEHGVRVALENGAVHECTRVALVGVAADVLFLILGGSRKLPLQTRGEAAAAAAAETGVDQRLDDVRRLHLGQNLAERLITVYADILVDDLGVDDAAVAERNAVLLLIEGRLGQRGDGVMVAGLLVVLEAGNGTALEQVLLDDLGDVFGLDHAVEGAVGINDHDRAERAKTEAAGRDELDLLGQPLLCQLFFESILQRHASGGGTARTAADQYMCAKHSLFPPDFTHLLPMTYSSTGLPPFRCSATTRFALSAVILT